MDHGIVVEGLSKSYADTKVLDDIGFSVPRGEFHALLGPSGSGKSTILRSIAGFVAPDAGRIYVAGRNVTDIAPEKRNVGVVFQNYALFPHMSVSKNVTFGLEMRAVPKDEIQDRLQAVLKMVHLTGYEKRRPDQLSGGQQQRVALARALIIEPDLLLLDEPLSALDRKIRQDVREELKRIQAETGITTIIVTHDQEEALFLAQRMLVLDHGRVRQAGAPVDVYRNPTDGFVAHFVGDLNAIPVKAVLEDSAVCVTIGAQSLELPATVLPVEWSSHDSMDLMVRPEHVTVIPGSSAQAAPNSLLGTLTSLSFSGPLAILKVDIDEQEVTGVALAPSVLDDPGFVIGAAVHVTLASTAVQLMTQEKAQ